ncbi:MAG: 3-keto-5-aminohexanoate cleavage protein [Spirochaetaceae bacterium]|nr:3-keto-5-aminohexanoate cleavage protein [Myxococcales bacterium]MCB9725275.1 3-keto-5-aminohexanoate cleavage protein [Spirochaetaceae bacterium]
MPEMPVIIEVALNGATPTARNPHAPQTQERLVEDAIRCLDAGASIVHTHAPDISVGGEAGARQYLEHFEPIHARHPEAILYPTLVFGRTIEEKTSHLEPLSRAFPLRMGFVDPGSLNLMPLGEDGRPLETDWVYANSPKDIAYKFALCERLGLGPGMAIFEPGFLRAALAWEAAGAMPRGAFLRFYFGGERSYRGEGLVDLLFGLPPTRSALDVYVEMLGDSRLPWSIAVVSGDPWDGDVARHALERGGHLRVGLEDYAGDRAPSNLQLVEEAVALCASVGRPVATAAEAGKILDLPR